ncbi:MAG: YbhB/YbcL family Raf kinase inhibitor-like protein [Methanomicrobiales archaeon]|nr:YbhB/YbcL family Raf kinase inhibitor-like protein [Methanomicrobiales archaeon]
MRMQNLTIELDFDRFPPEHTCDGVDISPPIRIRGLDAPYIAIIMDDPDASKGIFTHWLAWNIPATPEIPGSVPPEPRVTHPIPAIQGMNDFGKAGYAGPCPHPGKVHHYHIKVYGLDAMLDLAPGADRDDLITAMQGHTRQFGEIVVPHSR